MNILIPKHLQNPEFKFFLIQKNGKLPIEKGWNSYNSYNFFEWKLNNHIFEGGNYGIVTGEGNLIVLDFDSREYYEKVCYSLPPTFTVLSATRKLPHLYYLLKGKMFKKSNVLDKNKNVLMDIQANKCGIVAPGSAINRQYYDIINNISIAEIEMETLENIFNLRFKAKSDWLNIQQPHPEKIAYTMKLLINLGIQQTGERIFTCPFHSSTKGKNLSVMDDGALYCFHCLNYWKKAEWFARDYEVFRPKVMMIWI